MGTVGTLKRQTPVYKTNIVYRLGQLQKRDIYACYLGIEHSGVGYTIYLIDFPFFLK